jgi:hypothetical protein
MLMPERHEAFAWEGRLGKKFLLSAPAQLNSALRTSSGGFNRVNLRLKYLKCKIYALDLEVTDH